MSRKPDSDWSDLSRDLSARVAAWSPEWTDPPGADPGITLLELFAFLGESLLYRADQIPELRPHLAEIVARLDRLVAAPCEDAALTRNRYFTGKLMGASDFQQEQAYGRAKHRRHNRLLHGTGIVSGFGVSLEVGSIVVEPGVAIDREGEELVLCERTRFDPCPDAGPCYVVVHFVERDVAPDPNGEASRIEESAEALVVDAIKERQLAIARLRRDDDVWTLDSTFQPARVGR